MKRSRIIPVALIISALSVQAQVSLSPSVIASGGGYYEGENISVSWTLGEIAVTTLTGSNLILTQGFQQPFDVDVSVQDEQVNWGISAYPNPVGDQLRIRFDLDQPGEYLIEIQDVTGRMIAREPLRQIRPGDIVLLNTSDYKSGIYFLKVLTSDRQQVQVTSLRKL